VDDAVAVSGGRRGWLTLEGARRALQRGGGEILEERVWTPGMTRRQEERLYIRLSKNAARVGRARPRMKGALAAFLRGQREAAELLRGELRPVQWVVRVV